MADFIEFSVLWDYIGEVNVLFKPKVDDKVLELIFIIGNDRVNSLVVLGVGAVSAFIEALKNR